LLYGSYLNWSRGDYRAMIVRTAVTLPKVRSSDWAADVALLIGYL
jgi:hypothetical protein